ncbi:hypothetical protein K3495_g4047 [Podosphaera aphanis]|nr:hypothetical protein K3495_g4047 [Podosphaera aphanis]
MVAATVAATSVVQTDAPIFSVTDSPTVADNPLVPRSATSAVKHAAGLRLTQSKSDDQRIIAIVIQLFHAATGVDPFETSTRTSTPSSVLEVFNANRYNDQTFHGILLDTGAAGVSTAGRLQVKALQELPGIRVDTTTKGNHKIRFGAGDATLIGTIRVPTQIGTIEFEALPTNTSFLLCLKNLDRLGTALDNVNDVLCQNGRKFPIVR